MLDRKLNVVGELYQRHGQSVLRVCLRLSGGNKAWAEDVAHDVFVRLIERQAEIAVEGNVVGWLHTVAYRLCLDRLRRERTVWGRVRGLLFAEPLSTAKTPEASLMLSDRATAMMDILSALPPKERVVIIMRNLDGRTQREIANDLGYSEGYVSKLLARASAFIRERGLEVDDA